jgi:hypothetical protein
MSGKGVPPKGSAKPKYPDYGTEYIQSPEPISTRKLARKWGVPYGTICSRCRKQKWVEQRMQFQCKVKAKTEEEAVETFAQAQMRWAREYRTLQAVGLEALKTMKPRTAGEAARLLDLGIKGEMLQREDDSGKPINTITDLILELAKLDEEHNAELRKDEQAQRDAEADEARSLSRRMRDPED